MHDSHEPSYRHVQPQACIDELRKALKKAADDLDSTADWLEDDERTSHFKATIQGIRYDAQQALSALERTKP